MTPDAHMVETLRLRTAALHRVSRSNDQLRRQLDDVRTELRQHALANGGCVPLDAYNDVGEEVQRIRASVEALAEAWETTDSSDFRSAPLRALLSGSDVDLCDGCDRITTVIATDDGRAQMCPGCIKVANCDHKWVAEDFVPYCGKCAVAKP